MAKVCYGEFDFPDGRAGRSSYLQSEFLKAVSQHAPQVWDDLYELQAFAVPLAEAWLSWQEIRLGRADNHLRESISELTAALDEWARRWNLNEEWCLQRAYDALRWWTRHGRVDAVLWAGAVWGGAVIAPPNPPPPLEELPEYHPLFTFRENYLQSIRASGARHGLLKVAAQYCEQVEDCYEAAGYVRCKADEKRRLDQHLEWTVRFQLTGEGLDNIAQTADEIEKSTVLRAVYDLLRMIDLEKRADAKPGRRHGSKNTAPKAL